MLDPALLAAVAGGATATAIVLLVLWLRASRRLRALTRSTVGTADDVAHLEVAVADQGGRLRIVRELHDVAVHRVSSIVTQADGAAYAGSTDPAAASRAARAIAETGRETLADLRRVMTLVRDDADEAPGSAPLHELLDRMRASGLAIRFEQTGEPYQLPAAADVAVQRILQQALENSLQHGGRGTEARVALTWTVAGLSIRVEDDGFRNAVLARGLSPELAAAELGYTADDDLDALTREVTGPGIREMRARAELFGGTLSAVPTPGVGFSVAVALPTIRHHNGVHGVDLARR